MKPQQTTSLAFDWSGAINKTKLSDQEIDQELLEWLIADYSRTLGSTRYMAERIDIVGGDMVMSLMTAKPQPLAQDCYYKDVVALSIHFTMSRMTVAGAKTAGLYQGQEIDDSIKVRFWTKGQRSEARQEQSISMSVERYKELVIEPLRDYAQSVLELYAENTLALSTYKSIKDWALTSKLASENMMGELPMPANMTAEGLDAVAKVIERRGTQFYTIDFDIVKQLGLPKQADNGDQAFAEWARATAISMKRNGSLTALGI